jgi:hypothetical protein
MSTESPPAHRALQRLVRAGFRDFEKSRPKKSLDSESLLGNAINAVLVLCGVRPAARLDLGEPGPAFRAALGRLRPLAQLIPWRSSTEPLVVLSSKMRGKGRIREDVATVVESRGSDLSPPVSDAMGRLLGYRCRYEASDDDESTLVWDQRGVVSLRVHIQRIDRAGGGPVEVVGLAGFGCGPSVSASRAAAIFRRTTVKWGQAATRALGGALVTLPGPDRQGFMVVGFSASVSK